VSLAFVIPTRNEVDRLKVLIPQIRDRYPDSKIFIVDTPTLKTPLYDTLEVASKYGAEVIGFPAGFGVCLALGLKWASPRSDYIITMDADHDLASASLMYNAVRDSPEHDLAIGIENSDRIQRKAMNVLLKHMLGITLKNPTCGLRCYRSSIVESIVDKPDEWFFIQIQLIFNALERGVNVVEVPFPYKDHGKATENFKSYRRFFVSLFKFYLKHMSS
jgi:glycosyltransferase involved in cell wall biosynthesis